MTEPRKPQLQENEDHGLMTQADQDETVSPLTRKAGVRKNLFMQQKLKVGSCTDTIHPRKDLRKPHTRYCGQCPPHREARPHAICHHRGPAKSRNGCKAQWHKYGQWCINASRRDRWRSHQRGEGISQGQPITDNQKHPLSQLQTTSPSISASGLWCSRSTRSASTVLQERATHNH